MQKIQNSYYVTIFMFFTLYLPQYAITTKL